MALVKKAKTKKRKKSQTRIKVSTTLNFIFRLMGTSAICIFSTHGMNFSSLHTCIDRQSSIVQEFLEKLTYLFSLKPAHHLLLTKTWTYSHLSVLLDLLQPNQEVINGIFSYINLIHCRGEWIGVCKSDLFLAKSVDPQIFLFKSETTTTSGNRGAKVQK